MAALIRAHERDPRTLYQAPKSDRESAPGRYDKTASQGSPALERRAIRDGARSLAPMYPQIPMEAWDDIYDYDDIQSYLDGLADPDITPPDVPEVDLPLVPSPEFPETPPVDMPPVAGERLVVLHDGSVSLSEDGGDGWKHISGAPASPLGLSAPNGAPVIVATANAVYRSIDLASWLDISELGVSEVEIPILNGDFEDYTNGWDYVSGDSPRTRSTTQPAQRLGSTSYLTRDWVTGDNSGNFEISQRVLLSEGARKLKLTGAAYTEIGATATIGLRGEIEAPEVPGFDALLWDGNVGVGYSTHKYPSVVRNVTQINGREVEAAWLLESYISGVHSMNADPTGARGPAGGIRSRYWDMVMRLNFRFNDTKEPAPVSGGFSLNNMDSGRGAYIEKVAGVEIRPAEGTELKMGTRNYEGRAYTDARSNVVNGACSVLLTDVSQVRIIFATTDTPWNEVRLLPTPLFEHQGGTRWIDVSASATGDVQWMDLEVLADLAAALDEVEVYIRGEGTPANVYIDNVRLFEILDATSMDIAAIERNVPDGSTSILDRDRALRVKAGVVSQVADYGIAATHVAHTDKGERFAASALGAHTPSGQLVGLDGLVVDRLIGGTDRLLAVCVNGAVIEIDGDDLTFRVLSVVEAGSALVWSKPLSSYCKVSPSGMVHASDDLETWREMPKLPAFETPEKTHEGLSLMAAPSGRLFVYKAGWKSLSFLDAGATAWEVSGQFPDPIIDAEISSPG
ncbi:hypothetical protein [Paracoccus beibuensis]|uniref:hypothetical protein n=1 Tax=Paracoccus beibuensis TaxID=547602 RepID=UPI00223EE475|nr:hypothetical protein [Paracoccus beibuensis]